MTVSKYVAESNGIFIFMQQSGNKVHSSTPGLCESSYAWLSVWSTGPSDDFQIYFSNIYFPDQAP